MWLTRQHMTTHMTVMTPTIQNILDTFIMLQGERHQAAALT